MECAVKLTTTTDGRIAGSKRQLRAIAGKAMDRKNTSSQENLLMPVNKIKADIAICIALTVFFLQYIIFISYKQL